MAIKRIFLDLDGVLADFCSAVFALFGVSPEAMYGKFQPGNYDLHHELGVSANAMWAQIDAGGENFWRMLPAYPWLGQLVAACVQVAPVTVLTTPGIDACAASGKVLWLQDHFGRTFRDYQICAACKSTCAAPGNLLIDDSDANCRAFVAAGGQAILFPRLWNSNHALEGSAVEYTLGELRRLSAVPEVPAAVPGAPGGCGGGCKSGCYESAEARRKRLRSIEREIERSAANLGLGAAGSLEVGEVRKSAPVAEVTAHQVELGKQAVAGVEQGCEELLLRPLELKADPLCIEGLELLLFGGPPDPEPKKEGSDCPLGVITPAAEPHPLAGKLKDSGTRAQFETGAVRDMQAGKGRLDLFLHCYHAFTAVAKIYEAGDVKYPSKTGDGRCNWEMGMPTHVLANSCVRHLLKGIAGYRDEDHFAMAFWNLGGLIETIGRVKEGRLPASLLTLPSELPPELTPAA
jgi:hypothetical protein